MYTKIITAEADSKLTAPVRTPKVLAWFAGLVTESALSSILCRRWGRGRGGYARCEGRGRCRALGSQREFIGLGHARLIQGHRKRAKGPTLPNLTGGVYESDHPQSGFRDFARKAKCVCVWGGDAEEIIFQIYDSESILLGAKGTFFP